MTEFEWLTCTDSTPMLEFLRGKVSDRKLRLFACACCRRIWGTVLTASVLRHAVEVAERYADGVSSENELIDVQNELQAIQGLGIPGIKVRVASDAAWLPSSYHAQHCGSAFYARGTAFRANLAEAIHEKVTSSITTAMRLSSASAQAHTGFLRCLLGNPFRLPPAIHHTWLAWGTGKVRQIAQDIYEERAFDRLPILADALEDAGCDNQEILAHCRQQGVMHVRGCFVLDLLLGKE